MLVRLLAGAGLLAAICLPSAASAQYYPDGRYGGPPPGYPDGRYGGPPPGYPDGRYGGPPPFSRFFGGAGGAGGSSIGRTIVMYPSNHKPGTIVISTRERRLYLVLGNGQALSYGIGVGRVGFTWSGVTRVSAKREWPSWTPPAEMRQRRPDLPRHMAGGIDNPLGARAMYLGSSLYRIHGSNEPETIGQAVSSGCFRLTNEDVIDLYNRVPVGATVIVQQ